MTITLSSKVAQEMRYRQLKAMDNTIRQVYNDEYYIEHWFMVGIPDGSDEADFRDYAEDQEDFDDFLATFVRMVEKMDKDPDEKSKAEIVEMFIANLQKGLMI